jgi:hypothetical protein
LVFVFLTGLVLRLIDLTDEPLDFHPVRQLRGAILSRGMYYDLLPSADPATRQRADQLAQTLEPQEPPLLEAMVAVGGVLLGKESPWIARLINAVIWMAAGVMLYRLARRMMDIDGAVVAAALFLTLPFGVFTSRSFQPEAMNILALVATAYALRRWDDKPTWRWAVLAGVMAGLTVLSKGRLALIVLVLVVAVTVSRRGLRKALANPQVWAMGVLMVAIPAVYYLGVIGTRTLGWLSTTSGDFLWMSLEPSFYVRWLKFTDSLIPLPLLLASMIGTALLHPRARSIVLGMWLGFLAYGVSLPYTMITHNYYSLPLLPVVALGLGPAASTILGKVSTLGRRGEMACLGLLVLGVAYPAWLTRSAIVGNDYRGEPAGWVEIGEALPTDGSIIAVTHDYGYRLMYYAWLHVELWPSRADLASFSLQGHNEDPNFGRDFAVRTQGYRYFLVTNFGELEGQPELKQYLESNYPIAVGGPTFVVFDLRAGR